MTGARSYARSREYVARERGRSLAECGASGESVPSKPIESDGIGHGTGL